jgi:hypothetical protein
MLPSIHTMDRNLRHEQDRAVEPLDLGGLGGELLGSLLARNRVRVLSGLDPPQLGGLLLVVGRLLLGQLLGLRIGLLLLLLALQPDLLRLLGLQRDVATDRNGRIWFWVGLLALRIATLLPKGLGSTPCFRFHTSPQCNDSSGWFHRDLTPTTLNHGNVF